MRPGFGNGAETRRSIAARQAAGTLPLDWRQTTLQRYSVRKQTSKLPAWWPQKSSTAPMIRSKRGRKAEVRWINGTWTVTSCVTQSWCYLFCRDFDVANARVGAERSPLKTEVIHCVNDLGVAPPEWRIADVQNMASPQ